MRGKSHVPKDWSSEWFHIFRVVVVDAVLVANRAGRRLTEEPVSSWKVTFFLSTSMVHLMS